MWFGSAANHFDVACNHIAVRIQNYRDLFLVEILLLPNISQTCSTVFSTEYFCTPNVSREFLSLGAGIPVGKPQIKQQLEKAIEQL